jgi:hypothetical protein
MFAWKTQKRRWERGGEGERILKSREGQGGTRKQIEINIKGAVSQDYNLKPFLSVLFYFGDLGTSLFEIISR